MPHLNYYVKVKILDTDPKVEDIHEDVNEQTILVELPDGVRLGLFNSLPITQDLIGQMKDVVILVLSKLNGVHIAGEKKSGIKFRNNDVLSYQDHYYTGKVEEVGVKDVWDPGPGYTQLIGVNIGSNNILADLDREMFEKIKEGQYVEVDGCMSTLLDIR